mmetsp:Transcript_13088/g.11169  ORF Transcript_13088/g.11169 Transcript_13088/m.11169 type:complete len:127 (+) Transcript_13088:200-580(+)|eukprot:CAMPEP_0114584318 /NCGR_PEP_ID=MMETSP0125-20121206/8029_1 /TAXON_ID=485358 ORGANISM="Aristerostoma sp., Strain ATCC 50986" /NCGR_SAMPLE_ID=MMETSP0125 /ASSEMBLY_ACC=CAM_ASM_000245 /LENGTH=126 /DNA_ID=CAMNT_0001778611 /DNA_START=1395 /DNA_END=1775 /DNA_ORIENTATION=-
MALWMEGDVDEAIECIELAIKLNNSLPSAWTCKGDILASAEEEMESNKSAIEAFTQACLLNPDSSYAFANKGHALLEAGLVFEALEVYNHASEINPFDDELVGKRAEVLQRMGQMESALKLYKRAA